MKSVKSTGLLAAFATMASLSAPTVVQAGGITEAIMSGKASADFRLRYEAVDQENLAVSDADALTLRSRLGYTTAVYEGFSAMVEFEDSRIVGGVDDYTVGPTGFKVGEYSVIADPETTELDQAFIQYKNDTATVKLGRQVVTLDNHRFVGHVGWRQDRQTFDAFTVALTPMDKLGIFYGYLDQRNRIFAEDADLNSKDHLINVSYQTPIGKLTGYAYLLEVDDNTPVAATDDLDTFGVRLVGSAGGFLYTLEYADQEAEGGPTDFDAEYYLVEGGYNAGFATFKIGYEVLGSDDSLYGFQTPLATGHAFNGWSDQFLVTPATGLEDTYVSVSGKLAGGKWAVIYHEFEADDDTPTVDDLGDEFNLVYSRKFGENYSAGVKYASYSADDFSVDTDKLWIWVGASF